MIPTITNRAVLAATAIVASVGAIDAAASHDADLAVVFGLVVLLQLTLLVRLSLGRVAVPVRADLVRWLRDRADQEGDTVELLADRALAAYRADLVGDASGDAAAAPHPR